MTIGHVSEWTRGKDRRRLVMAVLAGGLVLGVGAAVTLAAWQDDEYANGTFTSSGSFNLVGQVDAADGFSDHAASPGGSLAFSLDADSLAPGAVVYSPYGIRLDSGTTVPAQVTVSSAGATGTALSSLSYGIYAVDTFTCDAASISTGNSVIPEGTALDTVPSGTTFDLEAATADTPGAAQYLCLVVTAGDSLDVGQTATAIWQFHAASEPAGS